jgi:hypothetical protein
MIIKTLFNISGGKSISNKKSYRKILKDYFRDDIFDLLLEDIDTMELDWYSVLREEGVEPRIILENTDDLSEKFKRISKLNDSNTVNWYDPIISKSAIKMKIGFCIDRYFKTDSEFIEYSNTSECSFLQDRNFREIYRQIRFEKEEDNYFNSNSDVLIADKYISQGKASRDFTSNFYWNENLQPGQFIVYDYYDYEQQNKTYEVVGEISEKRINTIDLSKSLRSNNSNQNNQDEILYQVPEYKFKLISYESEIKNKFDNPSLIENENIYLKPRHENKITRYFQTFNL